MTVLPVLVLEKLTALLEYLDVSRGIMQVAAEPALKSLYSFKNLHQDHLFQQKYQLIMLKYMPAQEHLSWDANTHASLLNLDSLAFLPMKLPRLPQ